MTTSIAPQDTQVCYYAGTLKRLYGVADAAFAEKATAALIVDDSYAAIEDDGAGRTTATTTADPALLAAAADEPVLKAIEQLRGWLNVSYEQVAQVAGFNSASLIHYWRRRHRDRQPIRPRASSVERLWRVHSILRSVDEALDGGESGYGVQMWARSGEDRTPLDLLLGGDLEEVEGRARRLLFDQAPRRRAAWQFAAPEIEDETPDAVVDSEKVEYSEHDFG